MADETKTNATPEAPGGPPAPEQTEQAVIPGMDGGPAPSGKVIDLSDVRAESGKTGPHGAERVRTEGPGPPPWLVQGERPCQGQPACPCRGPWRSCRARPCPWAW